ncbi:glutamate synthase-related protein [bacterium]|nr:IMP dehydrogenase [bacterium]MBU4561560.1 IMP dehydrogenase [bacterium]MCG2675947.1 glutamate synthase-related protein [bacterium]MCG2677066.1 glutamate synthase-related protein [bacterium]
MRMSLLAPEFRVIRDEEKCIQCEVCVRQCAFEVHSYDLEEGKVASDDSRCVGCHRCATLCPTQALTIIRYPQEFRRNANWPEQVIKDIFKQSETGGVLLSGMGSDKDYPIYWDHLLLDASQVTNPSIDPLREPMELRTFLGRKPDRLKIETKKGKPRLKTEIAPQLKVEVPILFSAMSYGAISYNVSLALAQAARTMNTFCNTGEGGLHRDLYRFGGNTIVQVASGRFGVHPDYLNAAAAIEIKIGQGAKPGIGGHLPGEKVSQSISETRMIPEGTDALSPAPHHDIYSIEDLSQLIYALKEATCYKKPIMVKIAAVHNSSAIASGMVRAGADIIALDGFRGGTGAAPTRIRDNVGIPIELALAAVDSRLRAEGIRNQASIIAGGGIRNSSDVVKAIALGADAVYIGTAALIAVGCHMCQKCYTGKCNWGIATQDPYLVKRINPDIATERLVNLLRAWSLEIKEMLGGMGINAIESLRGNRLRLRGIDLTETELKLLEVKPAGESL